MRIVGLASGVIARLEGMKPTDPGYNDWIKELSDLGHELESVISNGNLDPCIKVAITDKKLIESLLDLFFRFYKISGSDPRAFIRAVALLAKKAPADAAPIIIAQGFPDKACALVQAALGQRWIFYLMAATGPKSETGLPYMGWVWYAQMNDDLQKSPNFAALRIPFGPTGVSLADLAGTIDGSQLMLLYGNGGFSIADIVSFLASDKDFQAAMKKSCLPQAMWLYATHSSPVNGHVSLSASFGVSLAELVAANPDVVADWINTVDPVLGMTPVQFILQNLGVPPIAAGFIPFSQLTDGKRWQTYLEFLAKLRTALGKDGAGKDGTPSSK
jgi:hypothetical protein